MRPLARSCESGEHVSARAVAANVPPKLLFRDLVPDPAIDPDLRRRFVGLKSGSAVFRMNVALSELPDFTCRPGKTQQDHHGSGIVIGPTVDYLERAYLDARAHGWSKQPVIEMVIPSTLDPTLAPTGQHVASLFVQYVAPRLPGHRSWDDAKDEFADLVIDTVDAHAPNFKASVIARQVLSPLTWSAASASSTATSFMGNSRSTSCSAPAPCWVSPPIACPSRASTCAGPAPTPAAASRVCRAATPRFEIIRDFRTQAWMQGWRGKR